MIVNIKTKMQRLGYRKPDDAVFGQPEAMVGLSAGGPGTAGRRMEEANHFQAARDANSSVIRIAARIGPEQEANNDTRKI